MDTTFTFPRHQVPIPRPAPVVATPPSPTSNRESNALRASVLDVALELGIGNNSTVTNWMFNNSLTEEEEEELRSPSLTQESTATSEESSSGRYPVTPPSHVQPNFQSIQTSLFAAPETRTYFEDQPVKVPFRSQGGAISFTEAPASPQPMTPSRGKLRKKRADGYESDGGYISDAGKKKKDKSSALDKKERAKEAKHRAKEEKLQEKKEKEEERKWKKSLVKPKKADDGYDSDGASKASKSSKKSKSKQSGDVGYETDSGYVSSTSAKGKSKGLFFGLRSKQPKVELRQEEEVPPLPTVEKKPVVLPIALKFATTIDTGPIVPSESLDSMISRALDAPTAATLPAPSHPAPPSMPVYHPPPVSHPSTNRESLSSAESGSSMSPSSASSHSHSKRRGIQFLGQDLSHSGGGGSYSTIAPALQIPLPASSVSTPVSATHAFSPVSLPSAQSFSRDHASIDTSGGPSPAQHSPSFSLGSPPSAFPQVQHSLSNSLNSPPSAFSPQVFPTARNPSLSRGTSITRMQLLEVATSPPLTKPEHGVPPTPIISPTLPDRTSPAAAIQPQGRSPPTSAPQPLARSLATSVPQPLRQSPTSVAQPPLLSPLNTFQPTRPPPTVPTHPPRPSPTTTAQPPRPRPRFPPTDGFGPRPTTAPSSIPPSPMSYLRAPTPMDRPNLTIIPSSDYIVPSPRASPLPSPNVLAYYDIPPPSPPPSGPLPKVPPPGSFSPRSRTQERANDVSQGSISRSRTPEQGLFSQPIPTIQRGREPAFPAQPILPQPATTTTGVGSGLEATVKVPRYRELYALPLPREQNNHTIERREADRARDWARERGLDAKDASDGSWEGPSNDDDDEDMMDVLERFEEAQIGTEFDAMRNELVGGKALDRSHSFEAIRKRLTHKYEGGSDSEDDVDGAARESSAEDGGETSSRWSGSIYSRASVLDPEKSEEARQRFIQRVEDMYGDGGREKIPPVPKIPDAFIHTPGRSWTRF
ncbi:hypothetical protein DXG01_009488 [Tephrocybe rancida]|nr:hypothetical protein DXG01_009488 [Tephrocybe rancida]